MEKWLNIIPRLVYINHSKSFVKDTVNPLQPLIFTNVMRCSRLSFEQVILSILNLHVLVQ